VQPAVEQIDARAGEPASSRTRAIRQSVSRGRFRLIGISFLRSKDQRVLGRCINLHKFIILSRSIVLSSAEEKAAEVRELADEMVTVFRDLEVARGPWPPSSSFRKPPAAKPGPSNSPAKSPLRSPEQAEARRSAPS
jgi:hypothetical protein